MCRRPAAELHAKKAELDQHGIRLVSIVKENLDSEIDDFRAKVWPDAEVFVDKSKQLYRIATDGKLSSVSKAGFCGFICKVMCCDRERGRRLSESNATYGTNLKGEGFILGSLLVVDKAGTIVYAHAEQAFDDHPDFSKVVESAVAAASQLDVSS